MGSTTSPRFRLVDRLVLHEAPLTFARLAERVVTPSTRYLILDLDRTVHAQLNMGELLGWELCAFHAFGPEELARMEASRLPGRMLFDLKRPLASLRYLAVGARVWAAPGLYYLLFGKLPARNELLRRWTYRRLGDDPVRAAQRVPQLALLGSLARATDEVLRGLAERVWDRHADEQVITREDLSALRARHPGLRVVLTSASPRSMVEVAGERLGVDHLEWTEAGRINSGPAKIERLAETLPEALDPDVETVGITDTGYGEDHCWTGHFTRVVDVNSDWPFSPLVPAGSPLREIHSARLSTRREQRTQLSDAGRVAGGDGTAPARRERRAFGAGELARLLGAELELANALAADPASDPSLLPRLVAEARARLDRAAAAPSEVGPALPHASRA